MKFGSGMPGRRTPDAGRTTDTVRTDRREWQNSYVDCFIIKPPALKMLSVHCKYFWCKSYGFLLCSIPIHNLDVVCILCIFTQGLNHFSLIYQTISYLFLNEEVFLKGKQRKEFGHRLGLKKTRKCIDKGWSQNLTPFWFQYASLENLASEFKNI